MGGSCVPDGHSHVVVLGGRVPCGSTFLPRSNCQRPRPCRFEPCSLLDLPKPVGLRLRLLCLCNPAARPRVKEKEKPLDGMVQGQGGSFNLYPVICVSKGVTLGLILQSHRDMEACDVNKDKLRRKSFSATALSSSPSAGSWRRGFAFDLYNPLIFLSSTFHAPPRKKMHTHITRLFFVVLATVSAVSAHIKIVYPALRGPNVAANQPLFCGQSTATNLSNLCLTIIYSFYRRI